jgi:preprotein translocase subunit YajC
MSVHSLVLGALPAASGGIQGFLGGPQMQPLIFMIIAFGFMYFAMIRPQQRRHREHRAQLAAIKRGDTVILASGLIGKVVRVEETEVGLEIAQNTTVKVVKSMIAEVRAPTSESAK